MWREDLTWRFGFRLIAASAEVTSTRSPVFFVGVLITTFKFLVNLGLLNFLESFGLFLVFFSIQPYNLFFQNPVFVNASAWMDKALFSTAFFGQIKQKQDRFLCYNVTMCNFQTKCAEGIARATLVFFSRVCFDVLDLCQWYGIIYISAGEKLGENNGSKFMSCQIKHIIATFWTEDQSLTSDSVLHINL